MFNNLGLPVHIQRRKIFARKRVIELANQYVNWALSSNGDDEFWDYVTRVLIDSLINVDERKELVRVIYTKLEINSISKKAFLENVEPFVINGRAPDLGPSVMKDLVEYYESKISIAYLNLAIIKKFLQPLINCIAWKLA